VYCVREEDGGLRVRPVWIALISKQPFLTFTFAACPS
jgi:hypothetical protein